MSLQVLLPKSRSSRVACNRKTINFRWFYRIIIVHKKTINRKNCENVYLGLWNGNAGVSWLYNSISSGEERKRQKIRKNAQLDHKERSSFDQRLSRSVNVFCLALPADSSNKGVPAHVCTNSKKKSQRETVTERRKDYFFGEINTTEPDIYIYPDEMMRVHFS